MAAGQIDHRWPADPAITDAALQPRCDLLVEQQIEPGSFVQADGPFQHYTRQVTASDGVVRQRISYRITIPWFGWVFWLPIRHALRRPGQKMPWWAPPDRLTPRQVKVLGLLAAASLSATFSNTLFTQTAHFAADRFGISNTGLGWGGVIVRLGVVITLPLAMLADRAGRRRMLVITAWITPIVCALGAAAPSFWTLVATQTIGRPVGLAMALLVAVVAAEEVPRNSRAWTISVIALAGGLGAGVAVAALRLADLGPDGWRLVYVISLVWVPVAVSLTRHLPETIRFQARHATGQRLPMRRFGVIAAVAISSNLFIAPASFFQNRYLEDWRGYTGGGIALFTLMTATPASIGLIVGGRIADTFGRRTVILVCTPLSTALLVLTYSLPGAAMWGLALCGGILAGVAYPAFQVYRAELFATGSRGRANGWLTAISLAGGSVGLVIAGQLIDRGWSFGSTMALLAIGQVIAAVIAYLWYPETAHLELEQLNPQDAPI